MGFGETYDPQQLKGAPSHSGEAELSGAIFPAPNAQISA
jgi:hypothetical protein